MNVLVLGGSGFIGSHIVETLHDNGHSIVVFDRSAGTQNDLLPNVKYIKGSLSDSNLLNVALKNIDAVVHLISSTIPSTSNADPQFDISQNLISSVGLLQAMQQQCVNRIIYLSSGGTVYGVNHESPITEYHNNYPVCSYGIVKLAFEKYLHMYQHLYGIEYVSIRASNPYGPRQSHLGVQGVVGTMLSRAFAGEEIEIWGDGKVTRDFIYVKDLANLCSKCVESSATGCFNAGSGVGTSITELIEKIEAVSGVILDKRYRQERRYDVRDNVLDIEKAIATFNWTPDVSLVEGLSKTWDWLLACDNANDKSKSAA